MPLPYIRRALAARPNDSCSNDSENINNDGPCRPILLDLNWSLDTEEELAESEVVDGGNTEPVSGYDPENGYLFEEQWISCISDSELNLNSDDYLRQEFNFIYEIYTPVGDDNDDVLETLANFERNLSLGVSEALGLVNCEDSPTLLSVARSAGPWLRRSLTSLKNDHRFLGDDSSGVMAISMMPADEIDYSSACTSTIQTDEPTSCSHVLGGMTAWVNKADGGSIPNDDMFLNAVESYIKDDNSDYLGNGLVHVEYIGEVGSTTFESGQLDASNPSSTGRTLGLALAGAFFIVAAVGGAWFYGKKRNKNQDECDVNEKSEVVVKDVDDIQLQETEEITSFDYEPNKSLPSSDDLESVQTDSFDGYKLKRVRQLN